MCQLLLGFLSYFLEVHSSIIKPFSKTVLPLGLGLSVTIYSFEKLEDVLVSSAVKGQG